jgi:hypothetical protein
MPEDKLEQSQPVETGAEKKALSTADASAARNASGSEVKEVRSINPNKFESMTQLPIVKDGQSLADAEVECKSFGITMDDETTVTSAGIEAPAKRKVSVDPRPSFVEGLKAVGSDEEAQGRFSIEYMERKGKEAIEALQKPEDEQVLIASNLAPEAPNLVQMQNFEAFPSDSVATPAYAHEQVISRDLGASLKKGWDRTVQTVHHPDLIGWENPPEGGDVIYPRRGREDEFIDYDACSNANKAFLELAKYIGDGAGKIDPDLIAATIRNEQFYFDNTKDAGPENYVQKHRHWPFNRDESVGPAQMQVQNMEHLAKTYPNQLGSVADAVRNAIDIQRAPYFVGAYFADVINGIESKKKPDYISDKIWKQINDRWQKEQRNEALIIAYNPDPNQINHVFTQLDNIKAPDWD